MMPPKPSYKRGDVGLVLYPNSDLRTATDVHPLHTSLARADAPEEDGIFLPERCRGGGLDRRGSFFPDF